MTTSVLLLAAIMGSLPDETHAWAVHDPNRPRPPVVSVDAKGVPSDAIVLFDGTEETFRANWRSRKEPDKVAPWEFRDGVMRSRQGSIVTTREFGDCQLHVEWCAPDDENPQHGNSGVYLMNLYEVQIINSHEIAPGQYHRIIRSADEQAGCVYGQKPPLVNPIRKPGEWQTYDIVFHQPIHAKDGSLVRPGTLTIFFNGVLVQDQREIEGPTLYCDRARDTVHPDRAPLQLQDHNGSVLFRNIWLRELKSPLVEDVVSGTSVVDRGAVAIQRRANAERLLKALPALADDYERLVSALEMLTYSMDGKYLAEATRLAEIEYAKLGGYDEATAEKHRRELAWYFDRMREGSRLPKGWKLADAVRGIGVRRFCKDDPEPEVVREKIELFNGRDLSGWYTWIRTYGKNNDPKGVFRVEDGVIKVHGPEGYNGGITTERSFRDYRLVVEFRYTGDLYGKKLATKQAPDSGILFHSTGPDGAFYETWMSSFEYNLIKGANGDFWTVIDNRPGRFPRPDMHMTVRGTTKKVGPHDELVWDPDGKVTMVLEGGCCHASNAYVHPDYSNRADGPLQSIENPVGAWNTAELICDGESVTCLFNGKVVNAAENVYPYWGRIQLQNESCGCEFRRVTLYPLERNRAK